MPTYEYRCSNGHDFEKFYRTISASEVEVACPKCGQPATRRVSGGAGLVFKGSGFYLTDYGKNAHARRGDATPAAASGEASSSGAKESASGSAPSATGAPGGGDSKSGASPKPAAGTSTPKKGD